MRHFQTQSRCTILQFLMVASVQLTCPCPGASQQKTSNSSKYTMNPRARHIVATRAIVANTQHQHNELNAEAINSKRVIWSKSTWCDSKRTEKMFLEMNQKNPQNWKSKKTTNLDTLLLTCTVRALQHDLLHQRTLQRWLCARCVLVSQSEHQCSPRASRK